MPEPAVAILGDRFPRAARLRRRGEFDRCYRQGRRLHAGAFTLHALPGAGPVARLGTTVTRRVGGAVTRQRLKRWTREVFRRSPSRAALAGCDLVVHFRPDAARLAFAELQRELERLLAEAARRRRTP
ncbi:MAG: ribonuclease P protein component [Thermoanaerobaculia bacterium]|nr:ribonuclease P protein component [Thermoanaerobaculia bacterium]MDI9631168.1 ribonuclease P protein component [Acidobacteriota bacterium]MBP7812395.1 ribonuclease P protein component [Thermoanaerobaculia bacterium]MBP8845387.1 ribonuclease P protein component [Thermoanaerobaculia bacterium]HNZ95867.1 ribonuclease P protein component [Thermoanaerobaculia bacterium]